MRLKDNTRTLWVDALCINQEDNDERAHQVGLMGQIYSKSKTTLLWLGDVERNSPSRASITEPLEMVSWHSEELRRHHVESFLSTWTRSGQQALSNDKANDPQHILLVAFAFLALLSDLSEDEHFDSLPLVNWDKYEYYEAPEWLKAASSALSALMDRSWSTRVWAFQEAVLPPILTIICGNMTAPCSLFVSAGRAVSVHDMCCSEFLSARNQESLNAINRLR